MFDTVSARDLLIVAVQDLHGGEQAWLEKLPALAEQAGPELRAFADGELERSAGQASRLMKIAEGLEAPIEGPPNIWLCANLKDAERDSSTIVGGPLRDIALVGAFRKAKQSERVSYETAIGLAEALGLHGDADTLTLSRDEEARADADLAGLLATLLKSIG